MAARRSKKTDSEQLTGSEQLCEVHFPDGWEGIDKQHEGVKVTGVGCEHGTYQRDADAAPTGGSGGGQGSGTEGGDGSGSGGQGDGNPGDGSGQGDGDNGGEGK